MSDLPELLHGTIAQEHRDMLQAVWLSAEPKHEHKTHHKDCTVDCGEETNNTCTPTCPDTCTNGPDCSLLPAVCPGKEKKAAFLPAVAGWSTPPAPPVR